MTDLKNYKGDDRIVSSRDYAKAVSKLPPEIRHDFGIKSVDAITGGFAKGELIVSTGYTGHGKCHGKGTKVLMYDGSIKNVEDIKVGDKLMGDNSSPREVLSLAKGKEQLYKVSHKKDRTDSYVINESHILSLVNVHSKAYGGKGIKDICLKDYLKKSKTFKHSHKGYKTGVSFKKRVVPIDPYFIGLWLGDGHSDGPRITTADRKIVRYLETFASSLGFKVTKQIIENNKANTYSIVRKKEFPPTDKRCASSFRKAKSLQTKLKELNLIGDKHIPDLYKINSTENRLKLLAGLIDSDGWNNDNSYEIVQKSKRLSDDIVYLCRSLGLWAYYVPKYNKKYKKTYYRISIYGELSNIPVLLKRKKCHKRKQIKNPLHYGFDIKKLKVDDYYGFEIDGNHRYLLGDFTVTHNTTFFQTISYNIVQQGMKLIWISYELTARQFFSKYPNEVPEFYMPKKNKPYDLDWIEERIIEGIEKYGIQAIFIDHLHYVVNMGDTQGGQYTLIVGDSMRRLKQMAVMYDITVFLIAHTKQPNDSESPRLGSIRDSSFIAQEADAVYSVQRKRKRGSEEYEEQTTFYVLKQRSLGSMMGKIAKLEFNNGMLYDEIDFEAEKAL